MIQHEFITLTLAQFDQILKIPYNGQAIFTNEWDLASLEYSRETEGPYCTNLPTPDDIHRLLELERVMERISHKKTENQSKSDKTGHGMEKCVETKPNQTIMTVNCISDLSPTAKNKTLEARIYRKWIVKKPRRPTPLDYCCIMIDREGNAIQANMGKSDISHFSSLLLDGAAYKISNFMCTTTKNYQQTLDTETTLRYTNFVNIPADAFPKHYFNFTSYNQLGTKIQRQDTVTGQRQPTLTDYIGCLIRVGNVETFGSAGSNITIVRKLDIENLNGNVVELTLWDEMAKGFNKREFELMARPVIFAVSSCKVSEYNNRLKLLETSATHYYFNPEIPELEDLQTQFVERFNLHPPLEISKTKFEDPIKEKDRNRYPLSTLLQQNPDTYRGVRFTASITVVGINTARDWYYKSCSKCPQKIEDGDETSICPDHGPQPILAHRNCTTSKLLYQTSRQQQPLPSLPQMQMFSQFHFNPYSVTGKVGFYFDDILDKPLQITETDMPTLETIGESSGIEICPSIQEKTLQLAIGTITETETNIPTTDPSSAVTGTPAIVSPLEDLAANLAATSTPASVDTSKATEPAIMTTKGDPEQQKDIKTKTEVSAKRALFKDEPSIHKKKKAD
ncbi:nucleic acid-binding, OB-fold protein [Tanacetum coccineum]